MPNYFSEEVDVYPESTLLRMPAELDQLLMPIQSQAAARAEFKNLSQDNKEGLGGFSLRVRSLGDVANANMGAQARDDMNCE